MSADTGKLSILHTRWTKTLDNQHGWYIHRSPLVKRRRQALHWDCIWQETSKIPLLIIPEVKSVNLKCMCMHDDQWFSYNYIHKMTKIGIKSELANLIAWIHFLCTFCINVHFILQFELPYHHHHTVIIANGTLSISANWLCWSVDSLKIYSFFLFCNSSIFHLWQLIERVKVRSLLFEIRCTVCMYKEKAVRTHGSRGEVWTISSDLHRARLLSAISTQSQ